MTRPALTRRAVLGAALLALSTAVPAQTGSTSTWPDRPIRFIVAGPAGGGNDTFARLIATTLQASLKQTFVVENRPGANGLIGNDAVAKSPKDGYTFLFSASSSIALNPIVQPKMPYDTERDLAPVTMLAHDSNLLVVPSGSSAKSVAELVAAAGKGETPHGT